MVGVFLVCNPLWISKESLISLHSIWLLFHAINRQFFFVSNHSCFKELLKYLTHQ